MRARHSLTLAAFVTFAAIAAIAVYSSLRSDGGAPGLGRAESLLPSWFAKACGTSTDADPSVSQWQAIESGLLGVAPAPGSVFSFLTNNGQYMPRTRCMAGTAGRPDWPWIIALIVATLGVVAAYVRIMIFWIRAYRAERKEDRNTKLAELAQIFFWCAVCGYAMNITLFFWPGYRLLVFMLVALNVWSWRFVLCKLGDFSVSMSALRLRRELQESLERRNAELEQAVHEATKEVTIARIAAEDASAAKSRFLANTSHEIRTPLTSILGYLDLLESDEQDLELCRRHRAVIQRHGQHLLRLINDLLDLSKIEAGELNIERTSVNVRDILRDVVEAIRVAQPANTKVEISLTVHDNVPERIGTDPTRLRQIVLNLAANAVKFAPSGRVEIAASTCTDESGNAKLVVAVTDNGIGMTREQADRLFKPFSQADATVTRRFGGTGLGLSISRSLARAMGGDVTVTSQPGRGSTFTAVVSAEPAHTQQNSASNTHQVGFQSTTNDSDSRPHSRILIVDDSEDNRRLFTQMLSKVSAEVQIATDGAEACERILEAMQAGRPFTVVLMDMQMQNMDGDKAVEQLRNAGVTTPIIALTANALDTERARCLAIGFDDFATKPISRDQLRRLCTKWIDASDQRSSAA